MARVLRERGRRAWWKYSQSSTGNLYVPRTRVLHVSFDDPPRNITGSQVFRIKARKGRRGVAPFLRVELYYAGAKIATLLDDTSITSLDAQIIAMTWNANLLPSATGIGVEGRITSTSFAKYVEAEIASFEWLPTLA